MMNLAFCIIYASEYRDKTKAQQPRTETRAEYTDEFRLKVLARIGNYRSVRACAMANNVSPSTLQQWSRESKGVAA